MSETETERSETKHEVQSKHSENNKTFNESELNSQIKTLEEKKADLKKKLSRKVCRKYNNAVHQNLHEQREILRKKISQIDAKLKTLFDQKKDLIKSRATKQDDNDDAPPPLVEPKYL